MFKLSFLVNAGKFILYLRIGSLKKPAKNLFQQMPTAC